MSHSDKKETVPPGRESPAEVSAHDAREEGTRSEANSNPFDKNSVFYPYYRSSRSDGDVPVPLPGIYDIPLRPIAEPDAGNDVGVRPPTVSPETAAVEDELLTREFEPLPKCPPKYRPDPNSYEGLRLEYIERTDAARAAVTATRDAIELAEKARIRYEDAGIASELKRRYEDVYPPAARPENPRSNTTPTPSKPLSPCASVPPNAPGAGAQPHATAAASSSGVSLVKPMAELTEDARPTSTYSRDELIAGLYSALNSTTRQPIPPLKRTRKSYDLVDYNFASDSSSSGNSPVRNNIQNTARARSEGGSGEIETVNLCSSQEENQ